MSPKNAIKMINIQKFYSVQFGPFSPHWPYSVHIGPILSTSVLFSLFCPLWSFWSILSTLVQFGPIQSMLSALLHFSPIPVIRSTLVHFVHFSFIRSIQSTLVLFNPNQSYSVLFCPIWFCSVHPVHFSPIRSIRSYSVHHFLFGPILSIWSTLFYLIQFKSLWFILVHLDLFLCTYIMGMDI